MGMYTELIFGATLKEKTPTYVTQALNCVINDNVDVKLSDEVKQFIDEYSLSKLIWCTSYYFGGHTSKPSCVFDKIANRWCISFRANCKNYKGEIEKFVEFIKPYVEYGSECLTFERDNGSFLDYDTLFTEIREATCDECEYLYSALVKAFKDHDLGRDKHFTDSTYLDILDWLAWEFDIELSSDISRPSSIEIAVYEIQDYIWAVLCKETGNYQEG